MVVPPSKLMRTILAKNFQSDNVVIDATDA